MPATKPLSFRVYRTQQLERTGLQVANDLLEERLDNFCETCNKLSE
jgi:hypothetical protein